MDVKTMATNTFTVNGMTCDHCTQAVKDTLAPFEGVQSVEANLETGLVTVEQDGSVDEAAMKAALVDIGFEVP